MNKLIILAASLLLSLAVFFSAVIFLYNHYGQWSVDLLKLTGQKSEPVKTHYMDIPDITVAFGDQESHSCLAGFTLAFDNDSQSIVADQRYQVLFRDMIIQSIASKEYSDLSTPEGKILLKQKIRSQLNDYLKTPRIDNVYYTRIILQ